MLVFWKLTGSPGDERGILAWQGLGGWLDFLSDEGRQFADVDGVHLSCQVNQVVGEG